MFLLVYHVHSWYDYKEGILVASIHLVYISPKQPNNKLSSVFSVFLSDSFIIAQVLSVIYVISMMFLIYKSQKQHLIDAWRGDKSFIPKKCLNMESGEIIASAFLVQSEHYMNNQNHINIFLLKTIVWRIWISMIFVFVSWFNTSHEKSCSHGHVTSVIEGLQNVGLCCTAFVQEGIFIVSHVIYTWHKSMRSFPKYHPGLVAFDNKQGTLRIYSKLIPTRLNIIEIYMKHHIKVNKINSVLFRN